MKFSRSATKYLTFDGEKLKISVISTFWKNSRDEIFAVDKKLPEIFRGFCEKPRKPRKFLPRKFPPLRYKVFCRMNIWNNKKMKNSFLYKCDIRFFAKWTWYKVFYRMNIWNHKKMKNSFLYQCDISFFAKWRQHWAHLFTFNTPLFH